VLCVRVCVCLCVCERERENMEVCDRGRAVCECVYMCVNDVEWVKPMMHQ